MEQEAEVVETMPAIVETGIMAPTITPQEAGRRAQDQIAKGAAIAKPLAELIKDKNLSINLGGDKPHVKYEGWVTLATLVNCNLIVTHTNYEELGNDVHGFTAHAELRNNDGKVVGRGEAGCYSDEPNWGTRAGKPVPRYALRSMAQTRAASKAARVALSWIMALAGYSPTPAEEMPTYSNGGGGDTGALMGDYKAAKAGVLPDWINEKLGFGKHRDKCWSDALKDDKDGGSVRGFCKWLYDQESDKTGGNLEEFSDRGLKAATVGSLYKALAKAAE
jgi:hypothetical protein